MKFVLKSRGDQSVIGEFASLTDLQLWMKVRSPDEVTWRITGSNVMSGYRFFDSVPIAHLYIEEGNVDASRANMDEGQLHEGSGVDPVSARKVRSGRRHQVQNVLGSTQRAPLGSNRPRALEP